MLCPKRCLSNRVQLGSSSDGVLCLSPTPGQAAPQAPAAAAASQPGGQPDYSAAWAEYYRQQAAYYGTANPQSMGAAPQAPQVRPSLEPSLNMHWSVARFRCP